MSSVFVDLKITKMQDGENTFLKGYRKDTNENYFVFTNKDKETGEVTSRKLCKAIKVPQGEEKAKLEDVGYLGIEAGQYGNYLACNGHKISKNRFYKDGLEIDGVMYKADKEGNVLTYPSGDYIPMEEMTLVIDTSAPTTAAKSSSEYGI